MSDRLSLSVEFHKKMISIMERLYLYMQLYLIGRVLSEHPLRKKWLEARGRDGALSEEVGGRLEDRRHIRTVLGRSHH